MILTVVAGMNMIMLAFNIVALIAICFNPYSISLLELFKGMVFVLISLVGVMISARIDLNKPRFYQTIYEGWNS